MREGLWKYVHGLEANTLYNLAGEDRAHFLAVMPAELTQQLVPIVWKDEWASMIPFLFP